MGNVLGLISLDGVMDITLSPMFILIVSVVFVAALLFSYKKGASGTSSYSALDRLLHRLAFNTSVAQIAVGDFENRIYAKELAKCRVDRPVFITALPRAGTTLLLECFARLPEFASHRYRDMPFVLTPCLWSRFSTRFRQDSELRERAHGDGMLVNVDSPEALEELLWKTFWRQHYQSDRITPWRIDEENDEFEEFFRNHMRKIMLVRRGQDAPQARYVSKNNLNISRIQTLRMLFPDSLIIVPFREPVDHAASLLEQHQNFLRVHEEDAFAAKYMRAIGHFDFGQNLRPVDFDGWLDKRMTKDAENLAFWLEYWVAGYRHLLAEKVDGMYFVGFQSFCDNPEQGLRTLAETAEVRDKDMLLEPASEIYRAKPCELDLSDIPQSLQHEANDLYARLKQAALV
ncbi:MAG: sulfotransferase [Thermoleophilia bacterium]